MNLSVPTTTDVEAAATDARLSMNEVCRRAGVARSVYTRWKSGGAITSGNLEKIIAALPDNENAA